MKLTKTFTLLLLAVVIGISAVNLSKQILPSDEKVISYRGVAPIKEFTEILPDDKSTPLRLSKEQVGRFSWALLHSIAASYPKNPTLIEKANIVAFLHLLAGVYPCKICAEHLSQMLSENPVKNSNREELVYYVCDLHNKVNVRLNKPIFDCKKAFDFWGGDCGCDGKEKSDDKNLEKTNNTTETITTRPESNTDVKVDAGTKTEVEKEQKFEDTKVKEDASTK